MVRVGVVFLRWMLLPPVPRGAYVLPRDPAELLELENRTKLLVQDFIDESVTSCISKKQAPPLPVVLSYAVLANSVEFLGVASLGKCLTDYGKELNETKLAIASGSSPKMIT